LVQNALNGVRDVVRALGGGEDETVAVGTQAAVYCANEAAAINAVAILFGRQSLLPADANTWRTQSVITAREKAIGAGKLLQMSYSKYIAQVSNPNRRELIVHDAAARGTPNSQLLMAMGTNLNAKATPQMTPEAAAELSIISPSEGTNVLNFLQACTVVPNFDKCAADDVFEQTLCYSMVRGMSPDAFNVDDVDAWGNTMTTASFAAGLTENRAFYSSLRGALGRTDLDLSLTWATQFALKTFTGTSMINLIQHTTEPAFTGPPIMSVVEKGADANPLVWTATYGVLTPPTHSIQRSSATEVVHAMPFCITAWSVIEKTSLTPIEDFPLGTTTNPTGVVVLVAVNTPENTFRDRTSVLRELDCEVLGVHSLDFQQSSTNYIQGGFTAGGPMSVVRCEGEFEASMDARVTTSPGKTVIGLVFVDPDWSWSDTMIGPWSTSGGFAHNSSFPSLRLGNRFNRQFSLYGALVAAELMHQMPLWPTAPPLVGLWSQRRVSGGKGDIYAAIEEEKGQFVLRPMADSLAELSGQIALDQQALIPSEDLVRAPISLGTAKQYIDAILPPPEDWEAFVAAYQKATGERLEPQAAKFAIAIPTASGDEDATQTVQRMIDFIISTPGYKALSV
jgi:hypothetical protein